MLPSFRNVPGEPVLLFLVRQLAESFGQWLVKEHMVGEIQQIVGARDMPDGAVADADFVAGLQEVLHP
jgi:hypothetical protein